MFYTFKNTPFLSLKHVSTIACSKIYEITSKKTEGEFAFSHIDLLQQKVRLIFECI